MPTFMHWLPKNYIQILQDISESVISERTSTEKINTLCGSYFAG